MLSSKRALIARTSLSLAALAYAVSACAIGAGDDETATEATEPSVPASSAAMADAAPSSAPDELASAGDAATSTIVEDTVPAGDASSDVVGCNLVDSETVEIDLTNSSSGSATYWLTVGFYDEAETRLGDSSVFINYVRAGEHVVEQSYVFEDDTGGAATCQILDVDRTPDDLDADLLASASSCGITGEDFVGDVEAALSVTNPGTEVSDFSVTVAIVGPDGVRQGTGSGYIEAVSAQETAPTDVFTTVDFADGQQCEVVAVERYDS